MVVKSNAVFVIICGPVRLIPGTNIIGSKAQVDYLNNDEVFKHRISIGQVQIINEEKSEVTALKDLNQGEAIAVVKEMLDRSELKKLLAEEKRPKVKAAIKAQFDKMNEDDEVDKETGNK